MKRILLLIATLALAVFLAATLMACGDGETTSLEGSDTSSATTSLDSTPGTTSTVDTSDVPVYEDLVVIEDGKTDYQVIFPYKADRDTTFSKVLPELRKAFASYGFQLVTIENDKTPLGEYEILLGNTNREESAISKELGFNEAVIRVVGKKVVITGQNYTLAAMGVLKFIEKYMPEGGTAVTLPGNLNEVFTVDVTDCLDTGMTYADMAREVLNSFNDAYWDGNWVDGYGWWDDAEMLETYVDVYEATRDAQDKEKMISFAMKFIREHNINWRYNEYNDDIMWACIAFSRITILTGDTKYADYAKKNFDVVFERAWDEKLGGGLYWRIENTTKNSCVNCPAAIAACLIGQVSKDEGYFEKAKMIMDWEIKNMFVPSSGKVYDGYPLSGNKDTRSFTYNQGTFIGACTLLYKHYNDETYMKYAQKAADFAMKQLTTYGILDGEESGNDLPGFKGILTRWLYRYAKEAENFDILAFLQKNAAAAYQNRNADGLIWTRWGTKTPDDAKTDSEKYPVFGMSTAVALMYNCQQWW